MSPKVTAGRGMRHRPRGYDEGWCPQRETRELLAQVDGVLKEYRDHLPLTVRQIFYRLVAAYGYEKTERAYSRLGEHLVRARRAGWIDFEAIRDDGVVVYLPRGHAGPADFWDDTNRRARDYRRDRQEGQRQRLELWCEAAGMAPQLAEIADAYSVPVRSSGGFSSLTATRGIAERALDRDVPTVLLHVGDHDPSGASIFESMAEDAAAFVEADRTIATLTITAVRVALTAAQIDEHQLPTAPPKRSDSRSRRWRGDTCQLEALPPDTLAAIVRDEIDLWFDHARLERAISTERADRSALLRKLGARSESR